MSYIYGWPIIKLIFISLFLVMLPSGSGLCNNTWVVCLEWLWLNECVHVGWYKLSFVVSGSITNHNLRRVFVWHHYCWFWESASERVWVVWFQWLLQHAAMEVISNFILLGRKWTGFLGSFGVQINWLWGSVLESKAYCLSIFR